MFLDAKRAFLNAEREESCLQALRLCRYIYFDPPSRDDAITWKKSSRGDGFPHL